MHIYIHTYIYTIHTNIQSIQTSLSYTILREKHCKKKKHGPSYSDVTFFRHKEEEDRNIHEIAE